jgi:DNA-binding CsgD family transcriptional regulator
MEHEDRAIGRELTFSEIGERLGISTQMARKHYLSGLAKLRRRRHTPAVQALLRLVETKAMLR